MKEDEEHVDDRDSLCLCVLHHEAEQRNHFPFMNKSFNVQCNLAKFSTLIEYYHQCNYAFSALTLLVG